VLQRDLLEGVPGVEVRPPGGGDGAAVAEGVQGWVQQLLSGQLDGALVAVAAAIEAPEGGAVMTPLRLSAGVEAIALGSRRLTLLLQRRHLPGPSVGRGCGAMADTRFLLPPVAQAPGLHVALAGLGLLELAVEGSPRAEDWLERMERERLLLPAAWPLAEQRPWCDADLVAVPPPLPLVEMLWLVVPSGCSAEAAGVVQAIGQSACGPSTTPTGPASRSP
jgi:hypothetical protein